MTIVWRDQMSVGVKSIDADHRELINIVNQFDDLARRSPSLEGEHEGMARTLLGRLQAYARDHFAREERLQSLAEYAGLTENRAEHERLSASLAAMIQRYQAGSGAEAPVTAAEMVTFLNKWLVNHIIKIDLKMRGHRFTKGTW